MKNTSAEMEPCGPPLPSHFYNRNPVEVARDLIGKLLIHRFNGTRLVGLIVETEAYAQDDPACHAARGMRPSNRHMFGEPGTLYVYRSYGVHWCANAVTGPVGTGEAVLLRAAQPLEGLQWMRNQRLTAADHRLAAGPGNLTRAFGIHGEHSGASLQTGSITLHHGPQQSWEIAQAPRVGITKAAARPWRFLISGHKSVSRPPRPAPEDAEW
jgi:DNA-3-methyladenine glycosylase